MDEYRIKERKKRLEKEKEKQKDLNERKKQIPRRTRQRKRKKGKGGIISTFVLIVALFVFCFFRNSDYPDFLWLS